VEAERLSRKGTSTSKEQVECLLMLGRLQALNQNHAANKSEIEKIVASLGRSFGKTEDYDFPGEVPAVPCSQPRAVRAPHGPAQCTRVFGRPHLPARAQSLGYTGTINRSKKGLD